MRRIWDVPASLMLTAFLGWTAALGFAAPILGVFAPSLVAIPYLFWLAAASSALPSFSRPWWTQRVSLFAQALVAIYIVGVAPVIFAQQRTADTRALVLIASTAAAVSLILVWDQIVHSLLGAEAERDQPQSGYAMTFLMTCFPYFAIWFVHKRISALKGEEGSESVYVDR